MRETRARPNTASPESLKVLKDKRPTPLGYMLRTKSLTIAAPCAGKINCWCSKDVGNPEKDVMARTA